MGFLPRSRVRKSVDRKALIGDIKDGEPLLNLEDLYNEVGDSELDQLKDLY